MTSHFLSRPNLSPEQIQMLANILANAGQVVLGGLVFTPLLQPIDNYRAFMIIFGVGAVTLCWITSVWFVKKKKEIYDL